MAMNPFDTLNAQIGGLGLRGRPRPRPLYQSEPEPEISSLEDQNAFFDNWAAEAQALREPAIPPPVAGGLFSNPGVRREKADEELQVALDREATLHQPTYQQRQEGLESVPVPGRDISLMPLQRGGGAGVPTTTTPATVAESGFEMPDFSGVTSGASSSTGRNVGAAPYEAAPVTGYAPRATTPPDEAFIEYAPGIRVALGGVRMGNEDLSGLQRHAVNYRDFEPPPDITAIEGAMQMRRQQDEQRLRDAQVRRAEAEAADPQGIGRIRAQFAGQNALQQQAQASALERATAVTNARAAQQEDIRVRADMLRQQYENRARALQQEMSQLRPSENPLDAAKFEAVRSALANETTTFNQRMRLLNPAFIDRGADLAYDEITFPEAP